MSRRPRGLDPSPVPERSRVNATIMMGALAMLAWGVFEIVKPTLPRFAGPIGLVIGILLLFVFFRRVFGPGWIGRMLRPRAPVPTPARPAKVGTGGRRRRKRPKKAE